MTTPRFTLTGTEQAPDGNPHEGSVLIVPNADVRDAAGDVVLSGPVKVTLDATGNWTVDLPADDPSLDPATGLGYTIKYRLRSAARADQTLAAKPAGSTFDTSDLVGPDVLHPTTTAVGPGVAAGGTTGQALVKASDADYDTVWVDQTGGGGGAVDSVNGQTGVVVLGAADVGAQPAGSYATAAQGALADTAVQPADLSTVATTGVYSDLTGKPTLGTAAATASTDYATAAQGAKADTASQPGHTHTLDETTDTATRLAMTPAERTKLGSQSGTNTGDQVLPTWSTIAGKPAFVAEGSTAANARSNLGLGGAATLSVGTTAGTVAAGDDSRIGKIGGTVAVTGTPTAGQTVVASSGTAAAWVTPSASLPPRPMLSGDYIATGGMAQAGPTSGSTIAATYPRAGLLFVPRSASVNQISCNVKDTGTGRTVRIGLWTVRADGLLGTLILDSGALAADTAGEKAATVSATLAAGFYWAAVQVSASTSIESIGNGAIPVNSGPFGAYVNIERSNSAMTTPFVNDAFDGAALSTTGTAAPYVRLRIA